jgi:glycosyltransferase involved in cell wall biosynthesis
MRIGIDATILTVNPTGIQTLCLNLFSRIQRFDSNNQYIIYGIQNPRLLSAGCENLEIRTLYIYKCWLAWRMWYYTVFPMQLMQDKIDVFWSPYHVIPLYAHCQRIAQIYDLTPLKIENAATRYYRFIFNLQIKFAVSYADKIITISEATRSDLVDMFKVDERKITVIYPGYDDKIFSSSGNVKDIDEVLKKYKIPKDYILYVGTLQTNKNIERLVEAFGLLRRNNKVQHKLVIAGKEAFGYEGIYRAIHGLGLEDEVIITGYLPLQDLPPLMRGASVFVFPSLYEGFGLPTVEAMACGTPVITSNVSSMPEVVGDAGILVDPCNSDDIAGAMMRVISNDGLQKQMKRKGLERCKAFSWEKSTMETLQVIKSTYLSRK